VKRRARRVNCRSLTTVTHGPTDTRGSNAPVSGGRFGGNDGSGVLESKRGRRPPYPLDLRGVFQQPRDSPLEAMARPGRVACLDRSR
jgi:hypothetical protein